MLEDRPASNGSKTEDLTSSTFDRIRDKLMKVVCRESLIFVAKLTPTDGVLRPEFVNALDSKKSIELEVQQNQDPPQAAV